MELNGLMIIFLGDSITEGVGASTPDNKYVNVFSGITNTKYFLDYLSE